jgi:hypothetical protein
MSVNPMEKRGDHVKKAGIVLIVAGFILGINGMGLAQSTATQTVSFQINAIDTISVSGNPPTLLITAIPSSVADSSTTYSFSTNGANRMITGQITTGGAMPANTSLQITLQAPAGGGSSAGIQTLSNASAVNLVTGITQLAESGRSITYTFNAVSGAPVINPAQTRVVTLTITP